MDLELQTYFEILYNDSPNPCSITDIDTYKVVFMNHSMIKMLKENDSFVKNNNDTKKVCYQRMHDRQSPCEFCLKDSLSKDKFQESYIYNPKLDKHFRVNNTLLTFKGKTYNFCKYFVTSSYASQLITFEEAMTKSVEILGNETDFDGMTNSFLSLIGEFYEATKAYVLYLNNDRTQITSQYQWLKKEINSAPDDIGSKLPLEKMLAWIENRDKYGIMEVSVINEKDANTKADLEMLQAFKVSNITTCAIENENGDCIGVVGFSNKAEKAFDYRLLKTVTRFIRDGFTKSGMQDEIKSLSEVDFLTGFYSRPRYIRTLEQYESKPPKELGVVFVNINGLRKTNEYMGFTKGDEQIAKTAEILKRYFVEPFYRISGDEFVCFCENEDEKRFLSKVNRIQEKIKQKGEYPFAIGSIWKTGKIDVSKMVSEADTIMYINKQEYYHETHNDDVIDNDDILADLLSCISNEEFLVYLQPQINLENDEVIGAEALIRRFDKKNNKMVFPDQFIPLYEQKSIIRHVDIFVLNKVCQLLLQWEKRGKKIPISVNLSRVTLIEYDIVNTISKICDNYGIDHSLITIEVTERIGLIENDVATSLIDEFTEKGFKVSLDDFGCAYSNIVTLTNISVDEVKIDKSLVDNLETNSKNRIIVKSVIEMCKLFESTKTLAEGIEHKEQANILKEYGCDYGQGYLYSRPISSEDFFEKYIK